LQVEYSLIERTVERELVPMAKALNLGFTAWSPLARGMLTGKYQSAYSSAFCFDKAKKVTNNYFHHYYHYRSIRPQTFDSR
jgi:aryl-alcohol dehydrogenase-like predicted oxidoreductase